MAIWMDMTNSMQVWGGGVVGIVRAELEIAKNLRKNDPSVRFFKFNGESFIEISENEIGWLWNSTSVGDAYLKATGRVQTEGTRQMAVLSHEAELSQKYPILRDAYNYSSSRLLRMVWGLNLWANSLPHWMRRPMKWLINTSSWPFRRLSAARAHRRAKQRNIIPIAKKTQSGFSHPFANGDTIFSCGWIRSGKEEGFEKLKEMLDDIHLVYLIYDIIIIRDNTRQFYADDLYYSFKDYVEWVSLHCDVVLCGGDTTRKDLQSYQKEQRLPILEGHPVYFGSNIISMTMLSEDEGANYAKEIGITGSFIMAVGSMDDRKNYSTLYRAMTILAERDKSACPQLVIVGKGDGSQELLDIMEKDPLVKDKIILVSPKDKELDWLYRHSAFVVLASAWEGWSLTLPEALSYSKLVLVSDVEPLREVGRDQVVYIDPFDPFAWADKISHYILCRNDVVKIEKRVKNKFVSLTWADCGRQISQLLQNLASRDMENEPRIYMDISLTRFSALYNGSITGILRTELMLIRNLYRLNNKIRFFAIDENFGYEPMDVSLIAPLLTTKKLDEAFYETCARIRKMHVERHPMPMVYDPDMERMKCKEHGFWFIISAFPDNWKEKLIAFGKQHKKKMLKGNQPEVAEKQYGLMPYDVPFKQGDLVFCAGTGSGINTHNSLLLTKKEVGYLYCPIVYDLTPMLIPQTHREETIEHYIPFIDFTSKMADLILYGGETAQHDGIAYQKEENLPQPRSCAIKFGSDINEQKGDSSENGGGKDAAGDFDEEDEKKILKRLGIKGPFIMTVGTMEVRKNHETLYRAYLRLLDKYDDIPQMVFAGRPGWKTNDFLAVLSRDKRVEGKILQITPTDEELDLLYRRCEFTVLASIYEGWSLTLPESYWYGKFCLCCDTPALIETAGDLAEYIHRWDEKKWAERIEYYHTHPAELAKRENAIAKNWHTISWEECARQVLEILNKEIEENRGKQVKSYEQTH